MTLTPQERAQLRRALTKLIRAHVDDAQSGGGHPEDIPLIKSELKSARAQFWALFNEKGEKQDELK